jgi:hypothetical protein
MQQRYCGESTKIKSSAGSKLSGEARMLIHRFLNEPSFDQADISCMATAYEAALTLLRLKDRSDPVCELLAKRIIEIHQSGVHDAPKLCTA